ncbi:WD40-repeat-containing domain protein [Rhodocollybia butyracea]|uniref:WD40-repeat-containing domain protein n=1 Tax=Rhodocollybia butyracea TaxID=206335 RepID=A0A9P5PRM9_9AGAR|nr:WD40-repeat-containing domain protein [Rhodocollybia butyracea]
MSTPIQTSGARAKPAQEPRVLRDETGSSGCRCGRGTTAKRRNLVVCIDGTSNKFGLKRLVKSDDQLTFYNSGIGTYAEPSWKSLDYWKQVAMNKLDLALALRFEKILLDAYRWLSEMYVDGDRIFLFGFSRGAYQVRALAGMIEKASKYYIIVVVGLIHKGNEAQIPFAYELYAHSMDAQMPVPKKSNLKEYMPWRFKTTFSRKNVRVHFVGVWDTVSSVGLVRSDKDLPLTTNGMNHVCYFRHALALDERRVKFLPEYSYGAVAKPSDLLLGDTKEGTGLGNTKEVWFVGTHSDIGGGNVMNTGLNLYRPALRWMIHESIVAALELEHVQYTSQTSDTESSDTSTAETDTDSVHDSLNCFCWPFEIFCIKRLSYKGSKKTTWWPHLGAPRQVVDGQLIHASVYNAKDKAKEGIKFKACLPEEWRVVETGKRPDKTKIEQDLFNKVQEHLQPVLTMAEVDDTILDHLKMLVEISSSSQGVNSLQEINNSAANLFSVLFSELLSEPEHTDLNLRAIRSIMSILMNFPPVITKLRESVFPSDWLLAEKFLRAFSTGQLLCMRSLTSDIVTSVKFSPDGKHIVSGSYDHNIHIWDSKTGGELHVLHGHTDEVFSVAYSPDGKHIVSGSPDNTIRIWSSETGEELRVLQGHTSWVLSIACNSPDGKYIVSGSNDKTVRIWDSETGGEEKVFLGHTDSVRSVAISPDWKSIVSSSDDHTICIWNLGTGERVQWGCKYLRDIAFSASASEDYTVHIWDARTGKEVGMPLLGHEDGVLSVAYSPTGRYIASGSADKTVCI